ncbi:MAG: helix-turn-helix domain-containing protein [Ruminococcaceae bacterium]|nr:helix-turn-helix domain-containing protein [Oscillospiraceae bacterium]
MISFGKSPLYLDDISLIYLGRSGQGVSIVEHMHGGVYELSVITKGSGRMYTGNVPAQVKKGDVYVSFPFEIHKVESDIDNPLSYDFITFSVNSFRFADELNKVWSQNISPYSRVIHNEKVLDLIDCILSEFDDENKNSYPFSNEMLSALCNQMIVCILRGMKSDSPESSSINQSGSELCYKMMNYIDTHLYSLTSLSDMATEMGYNYSYLSALFRKTTTLSLSYYYRVKRLETARLLLAENKKSISQVADLMNYSSIYSFSKSFKEHYGISPRKYLQQVSNKGVQATI